MRAWRCARRWRPSSSLPRRSATATRIRWLPPPQEPDGKLTIGSWSDGDVTVLGGDLTADGGVRFTREQLLQLIRFITSPAIGTLVHSELVPVTPLLTAAQG